MNEVVYDPESCFEFCKNSIESTKKSTHIGCYKCAFITLSHNFSVKGNDAICNNCGAVNTILADADVSVFNLNNLIYQMHKLQKNNTK